MNAVVALLAVGGSTNHTMHLVAIAAAAGFDLRWEDFAALSRQVPLLARIYPNGEGDVNHFHTAGGTAFLFAELLAAGLMHADALTVAGPGMDAYTRRPEVDAAGALVELPAPRRSGEPATLRSAAEPFAPEGGIRLLTGNLGRAIAKTSALAPGHGAITARARVFDDQAELLDAFARGELTGDFVAVVRHQGPRANGMPELHKLTPALGSLLDRGQQVALLTDGRMSGASGKVPAAIHCTPEAAAGGPLALLRDGDLIALDCEAGTLDVVGVDLDRRQAEGPAAAPTRGFGRELFAGFRAGVGAPDAGASVFAYPVPEAALR